MALSMGGGTTEFVADRNRKVSRTLPQLGHGAAWPRVAFRRPVGSAGARYNGPSHGRSSRPSRVPLALASLPLFSLPPAAQKAWLVERLARPAPASTRGLSDGGRLPGREGPPREAAVLVPVVNRESGLTLLLTQRSADLPDHPGQIALPGGRVESDDASAAATALREATEETGLPADRVSVLGELQAYETVTGYRVTPVVGWVEPPFAIVADPVEVAEVFEVPLAFILDPANQQRHFRMQGERRRDFWAIPHGDHYIWGATAAMLVIFDRTLRAES